MIYKTFSFEAKLKVFPNWRKYKWKPSVFKIKQNGSITKQKQKEIQGPLANNSSALIYCKEVFNKQYLNLHLKSNADLYLWKPIFKKFPLFYVLWSLVHHMLHKAKFIKEYFPGKLFAGILYVYIQKRIHMKSYIIVTIQSVRSHVIWNKGRPKTRE